jgi:beta-alanine degradation protein BauB
MHESADDATTDAGTELLFENDHVRVWEAVLQPGEKSALHRHLHDHLVLYAEPGHIRGRLDGSNRHVVREVDPGWVAYRSVGRDGMSPHYVENLLSKVSTHYIIELLGESASETTQPPVVNDRGRVEFPDDGPQTG